MKEKFKKLLSMLAPLLGTGAVGVCPLCWAGSAALLSYVGLGVLILPLAFNIFLSRVAPIFSVASIVILLWVIYRMNGFKRFV